jgi:hypothetical protein
LHAADEEYKPNYQKFLANPLQLFLVDLEVPKEAIVIEIAVFTIVGGSFGKFIGGAIVAPSPPSFSTLTQIKFLPFAFAVFDKYGGSTIYPSGGSCGGASTTIRTTKSFGVSCYFSPIWRGGAKSFHVWRSLKRVLSGAGKSKSHLWGKIKTNTSEWYCDIFLTI